MLDAFRDLGGEHPALCHRGAVVAAGAGAATAVADTQEPGLEKYTLTLNPEKNRRIVIHTPATVSAAELKRIQQWLSFQLIVSDESDASKCLSSQ